jgi:phospholipid transport system transporter-binding protein
MFQTTKTLTVKNAKIALEIGLRAIAGGKTEFALADLTVVDSVAVATLLAWKRAASERGAVLDFRNAPANLTSLITA